MRMSSPFIYPMGGLVAGIKRWLGYAFLRKWEESRDFAVCVFVTSHRRD